MERHIVKPPLSGQGSAKGSICQKKRVPESFSPPQHSPNPLLPHSLSNSLSEQRQDISHRNSSSLQGSESPDWDGELGGWGGERGAPKEKEMWVRRSREECGGEK